MGKLFITIFLLVIVVSIIAFVFVEQTKRDITFKGVTLKYKDYEGASEIYEDAPGFRVCNVKNKECISFVKVNNYLPDKN